MAKNNRVAVFGAGSWGTALACVLSSKGYITSLWGHNSNHIDILKKERENKRYLPGLFLPKNLLLTDSLQDAVRGCSTFLMVVPSQGYRAVFRNIIPLIADGGCFISAVKGIENESLSTMAEIMEEEAYKSKKNLEIAVLSGPSFAREVADSIPTAVTIGSKNIETAKELQKMFVTDFFRVYASSDIRGLEISAAFKNIIAIATGICDGLGYGLNTRAALITRGLAEITRMGRARDADPLTFSGLSGMGDLILTCTGDLSRNRHVGIQLGEGKNLEDILKDMKMVAEGVKTTLSGYKLAQKYNVEMPILDQIYKILYEKKECSLAVKDLLSRELKIE